MTARHKLCLIEDHFEHGVLNYLLSLWFILRTRGVEIILRERSNSVIDWENYTEIRGLRKERGHIRFECRSLFNASIACFARLPQRVHAYAISVARTRFPKGQGIVSTHVAFVHVSTNETYLNGPTMEQSRTDIACLSQCYDTRQTLHRYVEICKIESRHASLLGNCCCSIFFSCSYIAVLLCLIYNLIYG